MKEQNNSPYDKISSMYDILSEASERRFKEIGLELLAPRTGEHILEPGCGTGTVLIRLSSLVGKTGRVTGIDLSTGMLDVCRKKIAKQDPAPGNIDVMEGDIRTLSLPDNSMDAVFISFSLELFSHEDMLKVLAQCRRVLREQGRIVVVSLSTEGRKGALYPVYQWSHKTFPQWVDCRPIDLRALLSESGFQVQKGVLLSMWGLPVDVVLAQ